MAKNCGNNGIDKAQLTRTKSLKHYLAVTLEELYSGTSRYLRVNRNIICGECQGTGSIKPMERLYDICDLCDGSGKRTKLIRISMDSDEHTEVERECELCWGHRRAIVPENRCQLCRGRKTVKDDLDLVCQVKPGMRIGQKIIYENEGPQEPNKKPGHVLVFLESYETHKVFRRYENDLVMTMSLDLVESLCGFSKIITTLDKRQLRIISPPGKVIQDKDIKYVPGEGMPIYKTPSKRGRLFIQFNVHMPNTIAPKFLKQISECLPPAEKIEIPEDAEDRPMFHMSANSATKENLPEDAYNNDADEEMQNDGQYLFDVEANQQNEYQQQYFDNNRQYEQMEYGDDDDYYYDDIEIADQQFEYEEHYQQDQHEYNNFQ